MVELLPCEAIKGRLVVLQCPVDETDLQEPNDPVKLQREIAELEGFTRWARCIGVDAKSVALLAGMC